MLQHFGHRHCFDRHHLLKKRLVRKAKCHPGAKLRCKIGNPQQKLFSEDEDLTLSWSGPLSLVSRCELSSVAHFAGNVNPLYIALWNIIIRVTYSITIYTVWQYAVFLKMCTSWTRVNHYSSTVLIFFQYSKISCTENI